MPAISTNDEFLRTLQRSGLLAAERLDDYLQTLTDMSQAPVDPSSLAERMVRDGLVTGYQARQLLNGKWQRFTLLGKYRILEVIGAGGMGKVFLCEHLLLRRLVAIKVLPIGKTENQLAVERFYREARAVAALDHPNIVRCFDVDMDGVLHFMVMEYVDGSSLEAIVERNRRLDVPRAAHYIRQAALGLQHAHQAGWVHRDIKPANILLDRSGIVKILDMGLARLFADQADNLTQQHSENTVLGTADYIAPEQAVSSHDVDIRADIYSLGATFYYLLSGRPPFHEGTVSQKLIWHQMRDPEPIRNLCPDVPEEVAAIVSRMLVKAPEQRYQTPLEVARALAPWTATPPRPPADYEMPQLDPLVRGLGTFDKAAPSSAGMSSGGLSASSGIRGSADSGVLSVRPGNTPSPGQSGANTRRSKPDFRSSTTIALAENRAASARNVLPPPSNSAALQKPAMIVGSKGDTVAPAGHSTIRTNVRDLPLPSGTSPTPAVPGQPRARSRRWLAVGLVLLLVGGSIGAWQWFGRKPVVSADPATPRGQSSAPVAVGRLPLLVTRNRHSTVSGQANTFDSVRSALEHARPGDRIVLLDQFYEERLVLDGSSQSWGRNVTIESGVPGGKEAVWHLPANVSDNVPVMTLANVEGLRLRGIVFDGEHRLDHVLAVSGRCPGLQLDGLHLRGFNAAAIQLTGCEGTADHPVTFTRLRTTTNLKEGSVAALIFAARMGDEGNVGQRHVAITDCRFEGPYRATVRLDSPVAAVEFRRNRCFRATAAFRYSKLPSSYPVRLVVVSNTFCDVGTCLQLETLPPADKGQRDSQLIFRNNLFARTPALVTVEGPKPTAQPDGLFADCEYNVRDIESGTAGLPWIPSSERAFTLPVDPNENSRFLRYPRSSFLSEAGADGKPVGVPPQ